MSQIAQSAGLVVALRTESVPGVAEVASIGGMVPISGSSSIPSGWRLTAYHSSASQTPCAPPMARLVAVVEMGVS
ncbi:MAG: hypothetical protein R3C31_10390 [Hyphomonadaceae bacterium]